MNWLPFAINDVAIIFPGYYILLGPFGFLSKKVARNSKLKSAIASLPNSGLTLEIVSFSKWRMGQYT